MKTVDVYDARLIRKEKRNDLKFRAWDRENKEMIYDNFVLLPTTPDWGATKFFHIKHGRLDVDGFDWADARLLSGIFEVMQFVGMLDSKKKEIYDLDIINLDPDIYFPRLVIWNSSSLSYDLKPIINPKRYNKLDFTLGMWLNDPHCYPNFKVVGNIYENPELLNSRRRTWPKTFKENKK